MMAEGHMEEKHKDKKVKYRVKIIEEFVYAPEKVKEGYRLLEVFLAENYLRHIKDERNKEP